MIVALALPFSWGAKRRRLVAVANRLEVPAVPTRRLKAAALEHGDIIPRRMRPPDTTPNKRAAPGPPDPARLYAVADGLRRAERPHEPSNVGLPRPERAGPTFDARG